MQKSLSILRWVLVTVGVIALTSITIDATSSYSISQSALGIIARDITDTGCDNGMREVVSAEKTFCIDAYEASPADSCPHLSPGNSILTAENIDDGSCTPESAEGKTPWRYLSFNQAKELCAKAGKRLPVHAEWYAAALGVPDPSRNSVCNVDSGSSEQTHASKDCVSASGAYDMVGNVWEWIDGAVDSGQYNDRTLPTKGFVVVADSDGVAIETSEASQVEYHEDYFWSVDDGYAVMMRGGYYSSGTDGGMYSIHADMSPAFSGAAVGFRCVKDL